MLGLNYFVIGQFEKAIEEYREAIRLNPNFANAYYFLSLTFIRLNRFDEAREIFERALQQKLDSPSMHGNLYLVAFIHGDTAAMKRQIDWAAGTPIEALSLNWQAETSAFTGKLRQAREFSRNAVELAQSRNLKAIAAASATWQALRDSFFGNCQQARADISGALASGRDWGSLLRGAGVMVECGDIGKAQSLTDELARLNPKDTVINVIWLPVIRARIEIQRGAPDKAIQLLQSVSPYERAALFYPAYTRGQAYLRLRAGTEAAAEFQKIIENRGQDPTSFLYPLAHLELARAAALTGDTTKSRRAYQDFFSLWKDADPDLPTLIEAKKEYEKIR